MTTNQVASSASQGALGAGALRYAAQRLGLIVVFGVILFATAGTVSVPRVWYYLLAILVLEGVTLAVLAWLAPRMLTQRGTIGANVKWYDRVFVVLWLLLSFITPVVAGLDVRAGTATLPWVWFDVGVGLLVSAGIFGLWAMVTNEHFEQFVRIQTERGHRVVSSGPYRFVRHPGYVSAILGALATPLILGSARTFVPAGLVALLFVVRTALEDRTLRRELEGYSDYAQRTRYRLLPGAW